MSKRQRVVVALSGGVDSSVAAALLTAQGFEVIAVMLRLWSESGVGASNRCCTPEAVDDARRTARTLHIPFHLLDCEKRFQEHVVTPFLSDYARGLTPNPCLACNRVLKFGYLLQVASALDADWLATGHYARVVEEGGRRHLLRAADANKDQSYILYALDQDTLRHVLFPIGSYHKAEVRAIAARYDLDVAGKEESQDLCFVRDHDYRRFFSSAAPDALRPGPIVDLAGRELGQHQGLPFYTVGQRRKIGVAGPEPLYVLEIDATRNRLIVGTASQAGRTGFRVIEARFVDGIPPAGPLAAAVQVRYTAQEVSAVLHPIHRDTLDVHLSAPLRAIAPGQAAVFYQGPEVLGGGIIAA